MSIDVHLAGAAVPINETVFRVLLDNSVASTYKAYANALRDGSIAFATLLDLARKGEIPYPLFFAPIEVVEAQVEAKTAKLLEGVSKETFSVGSRAHVELHEVELIVKDLLRKQEMLKRHDPTLVKNKVVGTLRKSKATPDEDASTLSALLDLRHEDLRSCHTKGDALELMIERLESNQILVSRSAPNYMPQKLTHVKFSGISIKDTKVPYVFLAGGDHKDGQEPVGRSIFTLALMVVLIGRGVFAPMTWDGASTAAGQKREYDIAGALLMPRLEMAKLSSASLEDIKEAADECKVTSSAVTVRAMRLSLITGEVATNYLEKLRSEYSGRDASKPMRQPHRWNAVRKYNGRELTRRMLGALDRKSITPGEFCKSVCLNRIKQEEIEDLRRAVR